MNEEEVIPQVRNCFITRVLDYGLSATHLLTQFLQSCAFFRSCAVFYFMYTILHIFQRLTIRPAVCCMFKFNISNLSNRKLFLTKVNLDRRLHVRFVMTLSFLFFSFFSFFLIFIIITTGSDVFQCNFNTHIVHIFQRLWLINTFGTIGIL